LQVARHLYFETVVAVSPAGAAMLAARIA